MPRILISAMLPVLALAAACSDTPTTPRQPRVVAITLDRTNATVAVGQHIMLVATPRDEDGEPVAGQVIDWSSQHTATATVTAAGRVDARAAGTTTVTARIGTITASATITVPEVTTMDLVHGAWPDPFGELRLYVTSLESGASRPLIAPNVMPEFGFSQVAVSPDGRRVAFTAFRLDLGTAYLFVADRDGGDLRQVTIGGYESQPTWSPDGRKLAFTAHPPGQPTDIWVIDIQSGAATNLTNGADRLNRYSAAWSPDIAGGSRIVFAEGDAWTSSLWTMRPDGSDRRRLTSGTGNWDDDPSWSPDGRQVVFQRQGPGTEMFDIWVVNADGSGTRALVSLPSGQIFPAWSPDGRLIAFNSAHADNPDDWFVIYTVKTDGSELTRRTHDPRIAIMAAWRGEAR